MKLAQRELELRVLKCLSAYDNAIFIASEKGIRDYHFLTKEPGADSPVSAKLYTYFQLYAEKTGGYKLTETVLSAKLEREGFSPALQAKYLRLWEEVSDTEVSFDEFPFLIDLMKERFCKHLMAKMFEDNTELISTDQIKPAMVSMADYLGKMHEELDEFTKEKVSFDMNASADDFFEEYDKRALNPDLYKGIGCGLGPIDERTFGFFPSQLIVFLAPTSGGKSVQLLNSALYANQTQKKKIVYFSFEMNEWLCKLRHVSLCAEVDYSLIKGLTMSPEDRNLVQKELKKLEQGPYFKYEVSIEDPTPEYVEQRIREIASTEGMPDEVFIDYIGNMTTRGTSRNAKHWEKNGDAAEGLFKIAKRYSIPIITAQQINRDAVKENRKNKEAGKAAAYYQDAASGDQRLMHLSTYVIGMEPNKEDNVCWYHPVKMRDAYFKPFATKWIPEYNKIIEMTESQQSALNIIKSADSSTTHDNYFKSPKVFEQEEVELSDWGLDDL